MRMPRWQPASSRASRTRSAATGQGSTPAEREDWFYQVRDELGPDSVKAWTRLAGYEPATRHRGLRGRGRDTP